MNEETTAKAPEKTDTQEHSVWKAEQLAVQMAGLVCVAILVLDLLLKNTVNCAIWAVYLTMSGVGQLARHRALKKRSDLVFGVVSLIVAAAFLTLHIMQSITL